ncbi:MAG TPA: DUF1553 domain-containing protein, partial [Acidobacteriota bacterium]|nr:DUF1553 domain-containing protein [Acidobacteriota bacterium]
TGRIPTQIQAREFLDSRDAGKRPALIDTLLNSKEYADYFASLYTNQFLGPKKDRFVDRHAFHDWLAEQFHKNTGWDKIASSLIVAEGNLAEDPALNWYVKQKLDAANLADDTARLFLGIQLGCARCHNHPHDQWKLEDFYGLAAFYSGLQRDKLGFIERRKARDLRDDSKELIEKYKGKLENLDPATKANLKQKMMQQNDQIREILRLSQDQSTTISTEIAGQTKTYPAKFLLTLQPAHLQRSKREELARWVISTENPFFAKAFVNRIWGQLMGKGFVEPVDDLSSLNTPSNPELLEFLASDFENHRYDIKHLLYAITNSRTYQLSSGGTHQESQREYETGKVVMLNADQLLNSFMNATSIENVLRQLNRRDYEDKLDLIYRYHVFLFDNDDNQGSSVDFRGTIPQALFMMNGKMTNEAVRPHLANTAARVLSASKDTEQRVERLFLCTLSRQPQRDELDKVLAYIRNAKSEKDAYEDVFWSLLNSNEFMFNH